MLADDPRPRAFGELARWGYYHGAALVALKEPDAARRALDEALEDPSRAWVQGRIHTELGKLADLAGDRLERDRRSIARRFVSATAARTMCASRSARALMKSGYR